MNQMSYIKKARIKIRVSHTLEIGMIQKGIKTQLSDGAFLKKSNIIDMSKDEL